MKMGGCPLGGTSLVLAIAFLLTACVSPAGVIGFAFQCPTVSAKAVKQINWTQVPEVDLRIRNGEFLPMVIRMRQGWPYVFRIRNGDNVGHAFNAYEFLTNVTVIQTTFGGKVVDSECYGGIWVSPHETVEIRMVATVDGHYEYEDLPLTLLGGFTDGPDGVIIIEERKTRI